MDERRVTPSQNSVSTSSLELVAFTDPASGKQAIKRVRARSAIIVIGMDSLNRFFTFYAWAGRPTTTKYVERLLEVGSRYRLKRFGIEANAMQALFADLVKHQARELKRRIPFVPVQQPTKIDKDWRIRTTLQPVIAEGRLFLLESQTELRSEIATFPMSPTKDLVDSLASAVNLSPRRVTPQARKDQADALASYLRASGADPRYIEERLAEIERESLTRESDSDERG